jgi:glucose-6-phosphate isomerase
MMIALEERIVTFLASFLESNAYDQPGVQDGKLAAGAVNKLSGQIVAGLQTHAVEGKAVEILAQLGIPGEHYEAEAIFNDIVNNHAVPNSYPGLESLKAARAFDKGAQQFVFKFSP